jgi:hypothetical protein
MHVRGLDSDAAPAGKPIEDEVARAAEDAGLEAIDGLLHVHGLIALEARGEVNEASRNSSYVEAILADFRRS